MLRRDIGKWDLVLLMINSIIGAGIFGLPAGIFNLSGIYSVPAMLVCAGIIFILVLVFAEVASRFDKTGGPYLYTLTAFGPLPAYMIGWLLLLTRLATYAALINLFATYLGYLHPVFQGGWMRTGIILIVTLFLSVVNHTGVRNSKNLSNLLATAKLVPLLLFVGIGLFFISPNAVDFHHPMPDLADFTSTVFILVFAFTGFEAILVNTGEIREPGRTIPFALITALLFVGVFYTLIQIVAIGTLPELATSKTPIADAAERFMGSGGGRFITLGAVISIGGTLHSVMFIGSRLPFALSESDQFPKFFQKLHPHYRTPVYSLLAFSLAALVVSVSGTFIYAVTISVISKILILLAVCLALLRLRQTGAGNAPQFVLPYARTWAVIGILACCWLLTGSTSAEFRDVGITMGVGAIFYMLHLRFKS